MLLSRTGKRRNFEGLQLYLWRPTVLVVGATRLSITHEWKLAACSSASRPNDAAPIALRGSRQKVAVSCDKRASRQPLNAPAQFQGIT